ncbi:copper amine oxidase N-terminal domain-containing protein [Wukongibacter baidiensis]|uniref:copper amine oxidase N-terminal domain-containing protein n=1 Tax=Wukongibacter baidiensis TaxID=1723361 RepID=UPI003D7F1A44
MNNKSKIAIGIILFFAISTLGVVAAENFEEIKVLYKDIKVYVNQKHVPLDSEPFLHNNRVYVPIRFISESLNSSVLWDNEENTVSIFTFKDFEEAKPLDGERFLYGEILSIDRDKRTLDIYQHIDDNSVHEDKNLKVSKNVIIVLQRNNVKVNLGFDDLKIGDIAGMVVNNDNEVRGIIISI